MLDTKIKFYKGRVALNVLAKDLVETVLGKTPYEIIKIFEGADLLGIKYERLMPFGEVERKSI